MQGVLVLVVCALILALLWVMLYDTTHFGITEYRLTDPRIRKSCRAAVIADLHNKRYGRDNELLLSEIRRGKPDFILVAGDVLTASPNADLDPALDVIRALSADFPIYYANGNHEHRLKLYPEKYGDLAQRYEKGLSDCGVLPLVNERKKLDENGICVVGTQIHQRFYKRFRTTEMEEDYLTDLLGRPDRNLFTILLAHNPDYFPSYAKWGADLVLSGHLHGGVARIPLWDRGVLSPAIRFFPKYSGGLFAEGKSSMIVSRGLGSHTIPVRLFNPGDLIFLDFVNGPEKTAEKRTLKTDESMIKS